MCAMQMVADIHMTDAQVRHIVLYPLLGAMRRTSCLPSKVYSSLKQSVLCSTG